MASLLSRFVASFDAIKPVPNLTGLDGEFNQLEGASGCLNGNSTAFKLLVKTSDANDPPVDADQVGAGLLARWKQNGSSKVTINNAGQIVSAISTGTAPIDVTSTTVCPNLNAASVGGIAGANVAQIGVSKVPFSLAFQIADPSTFGINDTSLLTTVRIPAIQSGFLTKIHIIRLSGSHAGGGSVTFKAAINGASIGSGISFSDANSAASTFYTEDFADQAISDGSAVTVVLSARSGTVNERAVSINVEGYQTIKA